jgi:hypothetical protein
LFKGYGAKVGLGNMRVKAENRMVTTYKVISVKYYVQEKVLPRILPPCSKLHSSK